MDAKQIKKAVALKNWLRFVNEIFSYVLASMNSTFGRSAMQLLLAVANGYVGSLAFADLFSMRFIKSVLASNPQLAKEMALHEAHAKAQIAGIIIMLFLDLCIFLFGFMREVSIKEGGLTRTINLEPWSLRMAILSAVLGGVGFVEVTLQEPASTWGVNVILQVAFGFIFSSIAPILMYQLTRYMRAEDGPDIQIIVDWVKANVKKSLETDFEQEPKQMQKPKQQTPQRPPITTSQNIPFDINSFLNN